MADKNYEFIRVEKEGKLFIVTIARPQVMNALHPPANHEMADAIETFANDPDLWVAIITGQGERAFSAGNDLKYTASNEGNLGIPETGSKPGFDCSPTAHRRTRRAAQRIDCACAASTCAPA